MVARPPAGRWPRGPAARARRPASANLAHPVTGRDPDDVLVAQGEAVRRDPLGEHAQVGVELGRGRLGQQHEQPP